MRHFVWVVALCACGAPQIDARAATGEIARVIDDWHDAAARADEDRYFDHLAEGSIFLGTDATERWTKSAFRAYAHPHFARGDAWTFRSTRREIVLHDDGRLAWFDEDLDTEGLGPARGSGVVRRDPDGRWRIVHYNLTITVPNERFAEVRTLLENPPENQGNSRPP
jgi:ketosteroid isomerase-like protein